MSTIAQANFPYQRRIRRTSVPTTNNAVAAHLRPVDVDIDADEGEYIFDTPWTRYIGNLVLNLFALLVSTAVLARIATIIGDQTAAVAELIKTNTCPVPELSLMNVVNGTIISPFGCGFAAVYLLAVGFLPRHLAGEYEVSFEDFRGGMTIAAVVGGVLLFAGWIVVMGVLVVRDVRSCGGNVWDWALRVVPPAINETEEAFKLYEGVKSGQWKVVRVDEL